MKALNYYKLLAFFFFMVASTNTIFAQENCATALPVIFDQNGRFNSGAITTCNNSLDYATCGSLDDPFMSPDVVYKLTVTSAPANYTLFIGMITAMQTQAFSSRFSIYFDCPSASNNTCIFEHFTFFNNFPSIDSVYSEFTCNTVGDYYIVLKLNEQVACNQVAFQIQEAPASSGNTNCTNAINLTIGDYDGVCTSASANTVAIPAGGQHPFTEGVWFTFTTGQVRQYLDIDIANVQSFMATDDIVFEGWVTDQCPADFNNYGYMLNFGHFADGRRSLVPSAVEDTRAEANHTYYLFIRARAPIYDEFGTLYYPGPAQCQFDICVRGSTSPLNDACDANVPTIPIASDELSCTSTHVNTIGADMSTNVALLGAFNLTPGDVWYQFTTGVGQTSFAFSVTNPHGLNEAFFNDLHEVLFAVYETCPNISTNVVSFGSSNVNAIGYISGLNPSTSYFIRLAYSNTNVVGNSTSYYPNPRGVFDLCFYNPPLPNNDLCSQAIPIVHSTTTSYTNRYDVNLGGATSSTITSNSICENNFPDVWYTFTPTENRLLMSAHLTNGSAGFELYQGDCTNFTFLTCGTLSPYDSMIVLNNLMVGSSYYLRFKQSPYNAFTFDFNLTVPPPAPSNDYLNGAASISTNCQQPTLGTFQWSSFDLPFINTAGCPFASSYPASVWYQFVAGSTSEPLTISDVMPGLGQFSQMTITVFDFDNQIQPCVFDTTISQEGSIYLTYLTVGVQYYFRIQSPQPSLVTTSNSFNLCLGVPPPPTPGDEFETAITISPSPDLTHIRTFATLEGATVSGGFSTCQNQASNDVWFKFDNVDLLRALISVEGTNNVNIVLNFYSSIDNFSVLYEGCAILSSSNNFEYMLWLNILQDRTIYINVSGQSAYNSTFSISVRTPPTIINDFCSNPISLSKDCVAPTVGATIYSSPEHAIPCDPPTVTIPEVSASIWFKFTAQNYSSTLQISNVLNFNPDLITYNDNPLYIEVFEGQCWPQECVTAGIRSGDGDPSNTSIYTLPLNGLTIGNTYYVRIQTNTNLLPTTFNICLDEVPISIWGGNTNECNSGAGQALVPDTWNDIIFLEGLVAQINPLNQNDLFVDIGEIYLNDGTIRTTSSGVPYLNRNYTINLTTTPVDPVLVRLYFTSEDYAALVAVDPTIIGSSQLSITKVSGGTTGCESTFNIGATQTASVITGDLIAFGDDYFVEFFTSSFSNFFVNSMASALPIELLNFTVRANGKVNELNWVTSNASNFKEFVVEKSKDGSTFHAHGLVPSAGNGIKVTQYGYKDVSPYALTYYRLKLNDNDGQYAYSPIVSVKQEATKQVKLFPNPTSEILNIELDNQEEFTVLVFDALSRVVAEQYSKESSLLKMDISKMPKGCYWVEVRVDNEVIRKQLFIK